jgi:hypothetical protein
MDTQRVVVDGEHPHPRETNETFEHDGCTVVGHRSPDREVVLDTHILAGLLCCSTDPTPLKSDVEELPGSWMLVASVPMPYRVGGHRLTYPTGVQRARVAPQLLADRQ